MPDHVSFGTLWNEAIACSLAWVDYSMAALTRSFLPPIGQITKARA